MARSLAISASTAERYMLCPQKHYLSEVRGFKEPGTHAQVIGTLWHELIDIYYSTERATAPALERLHWLWPGDQTEDKVRTLARTEKAFLDYARRYAGDGVETIRPADLEYVEIPIPGGPFRLRIKLDRLIKWDRSSWVLEHKFTTRLDRNKYNPNFQVSYYAWACRQMGLHVNGVIVDIAHVTTTKIDFYREDICRTAADDAETVRQMNKMGKDIMADEADGYYPHNWGACSTYGECYFRKACKSSPDIRERVLEQDYKVQTEAANGDSSTDRPAV